MSFIVDSVTRMLFRSTRHQQIKGVPTIFSDFPSAQKRLYQFSFQANSFINTVLTYVTDAAIGANHANFIERLTKLRYGVQEQHHLSRSVDDSTPFEDDANERDAPLSDVFSIMEYHARVMDQILEACFLKNRHQGVGGTSLVECMDTILRVGKLVLDLRSGRLVDQARGERKLIRLVDRFQICLRNLVRGLLDSLWFFPLCPTDPLHRFLV